jgi:hypothetical protein
VDRLIAPVAGSVNSRADVEVRDVLVGMHMTGRMPPMPRASWRCGLRFASHRRPDELGSEDCLTNVERDVGHPLGRGDDDGRPKFDRMDRGDVEPDNGL